MPRVREYKYDYLAERCLEAWERDKPQHVAVDTETSGFTWEDRPFCVTVSWRRPTTPPSLSAPRSRDPKSPWDGWESHYLELEKLSHPEFVASTILDYTPHLVFHNAKFDLRMLIQYGILKRDELDPMFLHDTEALAHLLDEHRRKGLKFLARSVLGLQTNEETAIKEAQKAVKKELGLRSIKQVGYDMLPRPVVVPYAMKDTEFTIRLWNELFPKVYGMPKPRDDIQSLYDLYVDEMKLTLVLLDMEAAGMALDLDYIEAKSKEYARKALKLELEIRDVVGNEDFNPNSTKQLKAAFAERGILLDSTNKQTLREVDDPLAELVMELRTITKMRSTYLTSMLDEEVDGILHPNFRQHGTKTGRMSSGASTA